MRSTLRTTSAAALTATIALGAIGAAPASAAIDDVIPAPPTPPVPLTFAVAAAQVVEGDPGDANVLVHQPPFGADSGADVPPPPGADRLPQPAVAPPKGRAHTRSSSTPR